MANPIDWLAVFRGKAPLPGTEDVEEAPGPFCRHGENDCGRSCAGCGHSCWSHEADYDVPEGQVPRTHCVEEGCRCRAWMDPIDLEEDP